MVKMASEMLSPRRQEAGDEDGQHPEETKKIFFDKNNHRRNAKLYLVYRGPARPRLPVQKQERTLQRTTPDYTSKGIR